MAPLKVFLDSDVVISSLISSSGAAYLLIKTAPQDLELFISNISSKELALVIKKLGIKNKKLKNLIQSRLAIVNLKESVKRLKTKYDAYTTDPNDAHIVAGAVKAQVRFLVTYNLRHFKVEKIKRDFGIILLTPGNLLQYLRSL